MITVFSPSDAGVDRRAEPGRAAADDHQVVEVPAGVVVSPTASASSSRLGCTSGRRRR